MERSTGPMHSTHRRMIRTVLLLLAAIAVFLIVVAAVDTRPAAAAGICDIGGNQVSTAISQDECDALYSLYTDNGGTTWFHQTGWDLHDSDPCGGWYGVHCLGDHVDIVGLSGNNLTGTLPPEFQHLTGLKHLSLGNNLLSGDITVAMSGPAASLDTLQLSDGSGGNNCLSVTDATTDELMSVLDGDWDECEGSCTIGTTPVVTFASQPECDALVGLYQATERWNWTETARWNTATDPCTWYGVTCDPTGVTRLDLPSNGITGAVPPAIGDLTHLTVLGFSGNDITSLPNEIGNMTALEELYLDSNPFTQLPAGIGYLHNLTDLSVIQGHLTSLPPQIGNLSNLEMLDVTANELTSLPDSFASLDSLVSLTIYYNFLTGNITTQMAGIKDTLVSLGVSDGSGFNNCLTVTDSAVASWLDGMDADWDECQSTSCTINGTSVPTVSVSQAECDALVAFYTSTNGPQWTYNAGWNTATDPCTWNGVVCGNGGGTGITELVVEHNHVSGAVPAAIGDLTNLTNLSLFDNDITSIPTAIGTLTGLTTLNLGANDLSAIPNDIAELTALTYLNLNENDLTEFPAGIGNLANLVELDIDHNQIPALTYRIMNLGNLKKLYAAHNQLTSLPPEIGDLVNLTELRLDNNQLTELPPEIGDLVNLERLFLSENQLTSLTTDIERLDNLSYLYLAHNQLTSLPTEIGNIPTLWGLYASDNQLTSLPTEIGGLPDLYTLDVSDNHLTSLSAGMANLETLSTLLLDHNLLSGDITTVMSGIMGGSYILTDLSLSDGLGGNHCLSVTKQSLALSMTALDPDWDECGPPAGSVVVYDDVTGGVFVVDVNGSGDGFTTPTVSGTVTGADTVGTAWLGGPDSTADDILLYSSTTGEFNFVSISAPDGSGHRSLQPLANLNGTHGWTHVTTGDYNGDGVGDILFYRATDGLMRFYTTNQGGQFTALTPAYFGTHGWTHLVVGDFDGNGSDDVMFYRATDGLLRFYEVTDTGVFQAITPAYFGTHNWTTIPAGDYDGDGKDDVMFYRGDGLARFYEVASNGTFVALGTAFTPAAGYTQIQATQFTPTTPNEDLAWYHPTAHTLTATRYNANGVVDLWTPQTTTSYGTNLIIATGHFPR